MSEIITEKDFCFILLVQTRKYDDALLANENLERKEMNC